MKKLNPKSAREILAGNILRRRTKLGLSQERLASIVGLHRTYVGAVERCEKNISLDNIEKIATALGCLTAKLLQQEEDG